MTAGPEALNHWIGPLIEDPQIDRLVRVGFGILDIFEDEKIETVNDGMRTSFLPADGKGVLEDGATVEFRHSRDSIHNSFFIKIDRTTGRHINSHVNFLFGASEPENQAVSRFMPRYGNRRTMPNFVDSDIQLLEDIVEMMRGKAKIDGQA